MAQDLNEGSDLISTNASKHAVKYTNTRVRVPKVKYGINRKNVSTQFLQSIKSIYLTTLETKDNIIDSFPISISSTLTTANVKCHALRQYLSRRVGVRYVGCVSFS